MSAPTLQFLRAEVADHQLLDAPPHCGFGWARQPFQRLPCLIMGYSNESDHRRPITTLSDTSAGMCRTSLVRSGNGLCVER